MIDVESFRQLALALPEAVERSHMGHPDFRVARKIFATLRPERNEGVVMLDAEQQSMLVGAEPAIFSPVPGGWGRHGATVIDLAAADATTAASALAMAWRNKASKRLLQDHRRGEGGPCSGAAYGVSP